jgi:hypothetical protein
LPAARVFIRQFRWRRKLLAKQLLFRRLLIEQFEHQHVLTGI